jgi:ribonucleoside-diphosphate reductase alpha chain
VRGGSRRAACLFRLHVSHPDVLRFLDHKLKKGKLQYANISLRVDQEFIDALKAD